MIARLLPSVTALKAAMLSPGREKTETKPKKASTNLYSPRSALLPNPPDTKKKNTPAPAETDKKKNPEEKRNNKKFHVDVFFFFFSVALFFRFGGRLGSK